MSCMYYEFMKVWILKNGIVDRITVLSKPRELKILNHLDLNF